MLLLTFIVSQYNAAWRVPFLNEDYSFLDVSRRHSILSLWTEPAFYVGTWMRPWSQGFHYWALQRLFGTNVAAWHAANFALAVGSLVLYYALARRCIGSPSAGIAASGVASLVGWGLVVTWIAGVQDLWMLALSLATVLAIAKGRRAIACVTFVIALLSKETAVVVPVLCAAWLILIERRPLQRVAALSWPLGAAVAAWGIVQLAVRSAGHSQATTDAGAASPMAVAAHAPLSALNLDLVPHPANGWLLPTLIACGGFVPVLALVGWSRRESEAGTPPPLRSAVAFGAVWMSVGWAPLLLPGLHWHSYYGLLGSLGAWLILAPLLSRALPAALVLLLLLGVLRAGRAATPLHDWGEVSYVIRAGR